MVNIADDLADRITAPEQVMVAAPSSDYFLMVSIIDQVSGA